jgi:hypothetical protein
LTPAFTTLTPETPAFITFTPETFAAPISRAPPHIRDTGSRSTSRSRGKKRAAEDASIDCPWETASSKRSTKKQVLHPAQMEYHNGTATPIKVTLGLFAALLHGDILEHVFPTFTDERQAELLESAIQLFMDKNPSISQRPSNFFKMSFRLRLLNISLRTPIQR